VSFTVTDNNSNLSECTFIVNVFSITIDEVVSTNVSCYGANDGSITITASGSNDLFYSIDGVDYSNTTGLFINVAPGIYPISVKDINNNTITYPTDVVITEPDELTVETVDFTNVSWCYGNDNASIDITVSGGTTPYSFAWSNGENSEDITNLSPNNYTVSITDGAGCITIQTFSVNQIPAVNISAEIINETCGEVNGAINLTVSPSAEPGKLLIVAVRLSPDIVISPTTTSSPPSVESVSLIRIQFPLDALVPNTSSVTVVVNDAELEFTTPFAAIIRLVSNR